jgi:hypothetical protein
MKSLLGVALLVVVSSASARAPDPREKLDTAIPEAIRLLEKKQYKEFLKTFLAPDDLKEATKEVTLDRLAEQFGKKKAAALLKALKQIKGTKPVKEKDENVVTYRLKDKTEDLAKDSITFVKVGEYWYLRN